MNLGPIMSAILEMECGRTFVPFSFGGRADNILYLGTEEQKRRYLVPTIEGERRSCFAITEPDAGSDARNIRTRARRDGDDRDMGWKSEPIQTMGEWGPAVLVFDDVQVPDANVLGESGQGFELAMRWIGQGRYMIPARAIGSTERMLQMAIDYAKARRSMGHPIAEYQTIQWMIADPQVEIEGAMWLTLYAAWRAKKGLDTRHASSIARNLLKGHVRLGEIGA